MKTCKEALDLIVEFEGILKKVGPDAYAPYYDPIGVVTQGIGSLWRADGTRVQINDPPITRAVAEEWMGAELTRKCEPAISRQITTKLDSRMHGALASFAYNLGTGALKGSHLRKAINEQRWADVPREFAKWRMAGGRILPGLVRRRAAESKMFMDGVARREAGDPANDIGEWVTEVTRAA